MGIEMTGTMGISIVDNSRRRELSSLHEKPFVISAQLAWPGPKR